MTPFYPEANIKNSLRLEKVFDNAFCCAKPKNLYGANQYIHFITTLEYTSIFVT